MADNASFNTVTINKIAGDTTNIGFNLNNTRIINLGDAINEGDAVTLRQLNGAGWFAQTNDPANKIRNNDVVKFVGNNGTTVNWDASNKTYTISGGGGGGGGDDEGSVKYDLNPDGSRNYNRVTLQGDTYNSTTKQGGTKITNVARGTDPSDAVNFDQLTEIAGDTSNEYVTKNGRGIRYVRTNDSGLPVSDAFATVTGSTAVGYEAQTTAADSLALGRKAIASQVNSVALGAYSTTTADINTPAYNPYPSQGTIVGSVAMGEVSVGNATMLRRVTNLAAGAADTDAVNVSQLKALGARIDDISDGGDGGGGGSVKYDLNPDGTRNYNRVTLQGDTYNTTTRQGGTKITNLARGEDPSDAVNMDQLTEIAGDTSNEYITKNGRGIRYVRTTDTGLTVSDAFATGVGATAVGYEAKASDDYSVALGYKSVTAPAVATEGTTIAGKDYSFAGAPVNISTVSVGSVGAERTITHVAAGRLSETSTDAVNGSQLFATNMAIDDLANKFKNGGGGMEFYSVTVDEGAARNAPDTNFDNTGAGNTQRSVAAGPSAAVLSNDSVALGYKAVVNADMGSSVALGANSVVSARAEGVSSAKVNGTTFSGFAGTAPVGVVSVGAAGAERQITNVAAGRVTKTSTDAVNGSQLFSVANSMVSYDTDGEGNPDYSSITLKNGDGGTQIHNVADGTAESDAVNLGQLNKLGDAISNMSNRIDVVNKDANAGTAGAMAMANMPQATMAGKSMFAAGASGYQGQAALAIGVSKLSDDNRWVVKLSGSANTRGKVGVAAGIGFHW
jgi:autotransporter adhesin